MSNQDSKLCEVFFYDKRGKRRYKVSVKTHMHWNRIKKRAWKELSAMLDINPDNKVGIAYIKNRYNIEQSQKRLKK